ncbi:MAG: diadenylate cyclase CdaA [Melioribacteraceae bacterium]|nr:diadenylate cyclase CdaA [Melioribacteraceae bacterium]MCF8352887.1 diadenylate cyclase CdaA [Melioribacteraceae bacterium]MCF8393796.1 diadenylate cyclase CdaA [Melioribacteraceae bacterium]MCF8417404.1 diadenylate cyclase CdaA [Melioribacteraceae bacterium]
MFDLFKIGFLTVSFLDVIDIFIVSFVIYKFYTFIKGTIAAQIFIGLILVLALSFVAQAANLKAIGFLLKLISDIWVIAFIIVFQPEIRRMLVMLGRNPILRIFNREDVKNVADIITDAAFEMAQHQHGALIVLVKSAGIRGVVETGEIINSKVNKNLLRSIFFPRSPLHDGAVIVKGDSIEAARCTLPLSTTTMVDGETLGMRHRAGLGITEQADVISVIVSEETGGISVAENGDITRGLSKESLRNRLASSLSISKERGLKGIFEQFYKQK